MTRIEELAAAHGLDTVVAGMEALLEQTARRAEAAFRSWPDRAVEAEGFLDDEGFEEHAAGARARAPARSSRRDAGGRPLAAPPRRSPPA